MIDRIDENLFVDRKEYLNGIMHICRILINDLDYFLQQENRKFGIMITFLDSIEDQLMHISEPKEELSTYNKISFLLKPTITQEFKKLQKKKLSKADSVITILNRLLSMIPELDDEYDQYEYKKYTKKINVIINKIFNKIKNKKKSLSQVFNETIKSYITNGLVGKSEIYTFSLIERQKKFKIDDDGVFIKDFKETNSLFDD